MGRWSLSRPAMIFHLFSSFFLNAQRGRPWRLHQFHELWGLPAHFTFLRIFHTFRIIYIFKGCRPCRRPRKRESGNGVSWLRSSVLWIVSLDALYIHYIYIYIYMHQIVYTCMLKWNFASSYPCHEAQASILLLSVFRGWCVLLPVRKT